MRSRLPIVLLISCMLIGIQVSVGSAQNHGADRGMVRIPAGSYRPFYITKGVDHIPVASFSMDVAPVTNAEFLAFVKANPGWARSRVPSSLAEQGYLKHWRGDYDLGSAEGSAPVVNVSWFAARAYAKWAHKRLPTIAEWEFAAQAPIVAPNHASGMAKRAMILAWYEKPSTSLKPAGAVNRNAYGLRDMFGQVWEWTDDFGSVIIPGDARSPQGVRGVCGAGAIGSIDPTDYATFMRFAMRSSLKANYTVDNVGFRCVR